MKRKAPSCKDMLICLLVCAVVSLPGALSRIRTQDLSPELASCYQRFAGVTLDRVVGLLLSWHCETVLATRSRHGPYLSPTQWSYMYGLARRVYGFQRHRGKRQRRRCVRKEYRMLTMQEIADYHRAVNRLKQNTRLQPNVYDALAKLHTESAIAKAHGGPCFLGWHRMYLLMYEVALGDEVPGVCLPYWDSSLDNELDDPAESSLFSAELIGNGKGPVITGPFAGWRRPQYEANATIRPPPLIRNVGVDGQLYSRETIEQILSRNDHSEIIAPNSDPDNDIEVQHGGVHMFIGGDMEDLETAPFDPIFFMHHAFIDYIWELFRSKLKNQLHVDPSKNYPMDHTIEFHGREDMMSIGNLSCGEGYSDRLMENVEYELSPSCSKQRPTCNSRFLRCKPEDGRCVPITLHESPLPYDPIPGNPSPGPPSPRPVDPRPDPVNPRPFPENQRPDPVNPRPFPVNQRPDPVNPRPFPVNQRPNPVNPRPFPVNQRPDPVNPRPFPVNQRPDPFNPRPFPVNQRPDPVNPRPFPVNQRPDPFNPRPFPVNQRPDPVNPRPFPVNQRPNPVNPRPFPVNQRPDPVNPRPFPVNQRPNPVNPRPFPVNQRPNPVNPRPFPVNQRPDPVNPRPFPVNQRPDPVNPRPFPVNQRPDTVNPRPFPVNQRPNPVNPRPFPVNPRPIPTGPRPVMLTQPPADPCGHIERERHNVKPYQNTYCINGVCDINRWVYVPVKVVTVRPPGFHRYRSFPVIKGDLSTLNDIYNPRAFERTRRLIQGRMGKIPKAFAQCFDDAIGQIFVHSQGMNYDGVYKESAIVDQRMATTLSIAYIAVKDPGRRGLTRVLFRAADSCGRVCHTSCKNPTTGQFEPCSGVIELDSRPPRMYSKTYGDATLDIWNFGDGTGFPIFNDDKFFLTFYCDYQDHLPWVDPVLTSPVPEPIAIQPGPSMVNPLRVMQKQVCQVSKTCVIGISCYSARMQCRLYGETHQCQGLCGRYAVCIYGHYTEMFCKGGMAYDDTIHQCSTVHCSSQSVSVHVRPAAFRSSQTSYLHTLESRLHQFTGKR